MKVLDLVDKQLLISYDPEEDILPMILANSIYSFKYSEGADIHYDFASFQSQIEDRIFSAKSFIDTCTVRITLNKYI